MMYFFHNVHRLSKILIILGLFCVFIPTVQAANTKAVDTILEQMDDAIATARASAPSGSFDLLDAYNKLKSPSTVEKDALNCGFQLRDDFKIYMVQWMGYFDFKSSFDDIFKRNECLREDIWEIEEKLDKLSRSMDNIVLDCSIEAREIMEGLMSQYRVTQLQLRFLRKYGERPSPKALSERDVIAAELKADDKLQDLSEAEIEKIVSVPYFHREYLDYDEIKNPQGCQDNLWDKYFERIKQRWERIKEKTKALSEEDIGKLFDFSEGKEARRKRVQAAARAWMSNLHFGFFRVGPVSDLKGKKELGKVGALDRVRGAWDGVRNFGNAVYSSFVLPPKSIEDVIAGHQGNISHVQLQAAIEADKTRYDLDKEMDELKRSYEQQFTNSSVQVAQDLENSLILAMHCIYASYFEDDAVATICGIEGKKSLPTFEKALDELLQKQCVKGYGASECIIPPKYLNRVK